MVMEAELQEGGGVCVCVCACPYVCVCVSICVFVCEIAKLPHTQAERGYDRPPS